MLYCTVYAILPRTWGEAGVQGGEGEVPGDPQAGEVGGSAGEP